MVIDLWERTSLTLLLKLKLVRPRKIVGLRKPPEVEQCKRLRTEQLGLYNEIIEIDKANDFRERMLSILDYFKIKPIGFDNSIFPSRKDKLTADLFLQSLPNVQYSFINFYGVSHTLPQKIMGQLIEYLLGEINDNLIINTGSNAKNQQWLRENLLPLSPTRIKIFPAALSILQLAAVVAKCNKIITVNTSILHVAHVYKIPVLLLQHIDYMEEHAKFPHVPRRDRMLQYADHGFIEPISLKGL